MKLADQYCYLAEQLSELYRLQDQLGQRVTLLEERLTDLANLVEFSSELNSQWAMHPHER